MNGKMGGSMCVNRFGGKWRQEMHKTWLVLGLLVTLGMLILSGCGVARAQEPIDETTPAPVDVLGPEGARDAALAYVREHLEAAPAAGLDWVAEDLTPEGLLGKSTLRYTAGDWTVTVAYPVVHPALVVYEVEVTGKALGFEWRGQVDAAGQVTEDAGLR